MSNLVVAPHPFKPERKILPLPEGMTIADMVNAADIRLELRSTIRVFVGGAEIPRELWTVTKPKAGHNVLIKSFAVHGGGGDGKNPLRTIAMVAVMVAAVYLGQVYGANLAIGMFGQGSAYVASAAEIAIGTAIISGTVSLVGSALVNALLPITPPAMRGLDAGAYGGAAVSPALAVTGTQNRLNPYGVIAKIYGKRRTFPSLAALPYNEISGSDQYIRMLFCVGYGPLKIEDIRIGNTPLSAYYGVEYEVRQGYQDDSQVTLYTTTIKQEGLSALLSGESSSATSSGDAEIVQGGAFVEKNSPNALDDFLVATISFPNGLGATSAVAPAGYDEWGSPYWNLSGGGTTSVPQYTTSTQSVSFVVEYKETPAGAWGAPASLAVGTNMTKVGNIVTVSAATTNAFTTTVTIKANRGQGGIRLQRTTDATGRTTNYSSITSQTVNWASRTTQVDTQEISGDVEFRQGLVYFNDSGGRSSVTVDLEVEVSPSGLDQWVKAPLVYDSTSQSALAGDYQDAATVAALADVEAALGYATETGQAQVAKLTASGVKLSTTGKLRFTDANPQAVRHSFRFVCGAGKYDVRVRRLTANATSDRQIDLVTWTALRSIKPVYPVRKTGLALIAIRIKATEQLNGVLDRLNCVATSILPVWNGASWVEEETQNPAWHFCDVLRGAANKRPVADSRLDLTEIKAWADWCAATAPNASEPMITYNAVHDTKTTVFEMLNLLAASGRARFAMRAGKFSVVRDVEQSVVIEHFTPRNSSGFKSTINFPPKLHALSVRFINPDKDWAEDERIVYVDGYDESNASLFERIDMLHCTSSTQAWREARYHLAANTLRRETYSLTVAAEALSVQVGDLVRVAHDVPSWGLAYGRIEALVYDASNDVVGLEFDERFTMDPLKNYVVRVRREDGTSQVLPIETAGGTDIYIVTLTTPLAIAEAPEVGDLFMLGELGSDTAELIIKSIKPGAEGTATLELLDAAPAVHTSYTGIIPPFNSNITATTPVVFATPPVPTFTVTDVVLSDLTVQMQLDCDTFEAGTVAVDSVQVEYKVSSASSWSRITPIGPSDIAKIDNVSDMVQYTIRARSVSKYGRVSSWRTTNYTPAGLSAAPDDVTSFKLSVVDNIAYLTWNPNASVGVTHYEVRYTPELSGYSWGTMQILLEQVSGNSAAVPALNGTYAIKAMRGTRSESENAAFLSTMVNDILNMNVVASEVEAPLFEGVKTSVWVRDAALELLPLDEVEDYANVDEVNNFDLGDSGFEGEGYYEFTNPVLLDGIFTSRLTASIQATAITTGDFIDLWENVDLVLDFDGTDPGGWTVSLEIATTDDGLAWGTWTPFIVGNYTCAGFKFRTKLTSTDANVTPHVTGLTVEVDMPDRVAGAEDVVCPDTGLSVVFAPAFRERPAIAVTPQDMTTGDTWAITGQSATGFTIVFKNSAGVGVQRTFDYIARGYGAVS